MRCVFWIVMYSFALTAGYAVSAEEGSVKPIASLDAPRYMGRWYEIAKYPNRFQKKCVANIWAEYTLKDSGRIEVINRCQLVNGEISAIVGEARQIDGVNSPRLEVRFAPKWLSFLPFVWGDYWVVALDEGYQLAAVSEPSRTYLWILSRSPSARSAEYNALLDELKAQGFDTRRLEITPQQ